MNLDESRLYTMKNILMALMAMRINLGLGDVGHGLGATTKRKMFFHKN
jgi:hypothetical protein